MIGLASMLLSASVNHIATILRERIRAGQYPAGRWLPTERELVEEFGVSRTIINKAIDVLEESQLVVRAPRCRTIVNGSVNTKPPEDAGQRRNLGLWIWPVPPDPASVAIVRGIYQMMDMEHFRLIMESPVDTRWESVVQSEGRFLERMVADRDIAGVLLWCLADNANLPAMQAVRIAGVPMVFLDREPPMGLEADYVGIDNEQAARQVVQHLIDCGHRSIAHITNLDTASTVLQRKAGYRRALEKAGIPYREDLIIPGEDVNWRDADLAYLPLVERILELPDPPTALFAVNDNIAAWLIRAIRRRGLQVPGDIAVAGFDGLEHYKGFDPFITTAIQPFERIGAHAVELLLWRINQGPTSTYRHVLLEAPLSVHGSTRPHDAERADRTDPSSLIQNHSFSV